jgi:hypothetical protein
MPNSMAASSTEARKALESRLLGREIALVLGKDMVYNKGLSGRVKRMSANYQSENGHETKATVYM